jgi:hypothetical protein
MKPDTLAENAEPGEALSGRGSTSPTTFPLLSKTEPLKLPLMAIEPEPSKKLRLAPISEYVRLNGWTVSWLSEIS